MSSDLYASLPIVESLRLNTLKTQGPDILTYQQCIYRPTWLQNARTALMKKEKIIECMPPTTMKVTKHWWAWSKNTAYGSVFFVSFIGWPRLPRGCSGKESACKCRRHKRCRFDPWVGKIPWRRKWHPTPVFLPGNPKDRGAWWAMVHGATKCQTPQRNWVPT